MLTFCIFTYLIIALRSWFINSVKYIFHLISYFIRNHHPVGPSNRISKGPSNARSRRASNASLENNEFNGSIRSSNHGSAEKNSTFQIGDQNSLADSIPSEEYIPIAEDDNEALSLKHQGANPTK